MAAMAEVQHRNQLLGAALTLALVAGGIVLADYGPVWVFIAAAALVAVLFSLAYVRDRRRGIRWF
jgi:hypothetical protein